MILKHLNLVNARRSETKHIPSKMSETHAPKEENPSKTKETYQNKSETIKRILANNTEIHPSSLKDLPDLPSKKSSHHLSVHKAGCG